MPYEIIYRKMCASMPMTAKDLRAILADKRIADDVFIRIVDEDDTELDVKEVRLNLAISKNPESATVADCDPDMLVIRLD